MGPNGRVWGDDVFWMDVLIQGVGWLLVLTSIITSARFFYVQRKNEIADNQLRQDQEAARARTERQDRIAAEVGEVLRELTQLIFNHWWQVYFFPFYYRLIIARAGSTLVHVRPGIEDARLQEFVDGLRTVLHYSAHSEHFGRLVILPTRRFLSIMERQKDAAIAASEAFSLFLTHGGELDMSWLATFEKAWEDGEATLSSRLIHALKRKTPEPTT